MSKSKAQPTLSQMLQLLLDVGVICESDSSESAVTVSKQTNMTPSILIEYPERADAPGALLHMWAPDDEDKVWAITYSGDDGITYVPWDKAAPQVMRETLQHIAGIYKMRIYPASCDGWKAFTMNFPVTK